MTDRKGKPKGPAPSWDDDDARTVFDDSPLQPKPRSPSVEQQAVPPSERVSLPDFGSLTNAWREQEAPPEEDGSALDTPELRRTTLPLVEAAPNQPNADFSEVTKQQILMPQSYRRTDDYEATPLTHAYTPGHLPHAPLGPKEGVASVHFEHTQIVPAFDEHPTDPGIFKADDTSTSGSYSSPVQTDPHNPPFELLDGESYLQEPRYDAKEPIGKGGMSLITRVYDRHLMRDSAMKILDAKLAKDITHVRRFLEEAQITGQLEHPNIVPVHGLGIGNAGQRYFTMKLVHGQNLKEYLHSTPYDPSDESDLYRVLQIFLRVCDALAYAHSRGVIHRDLKPSNIMVGSHGQVYIMDWGIAYVLPEYRQGGPSSSESSVRLRPNSKEIQGDIMGTWNYMAPEQAKGETDRLGVHTDIFALGALLYELLTDAPPYQHDSIYVMLQHAQRAEFPPPQERNPNVHLPTGLCQIVMKAMQEQPEDRYASVEELKAEVEVFLRRGEQFGHKDFDPGELIIREGDTGDEAYIISKGHCRVFKYVDQRKIELRQMGPGEVFGETAIFLSDRRTASVEAIDHVTVVVMSKAGLQQRLEHDTWLGRFVETVANRFVDVDHKATSLQSELERSQLTNQALRYLLDHGIPTSHGKTAPWSPLANQLSSSHHHSAQELASMLQSFGEFAIDLHRDQITLLH